MQDSRSIYITKTMILEFLSLEHSSNEKLGETVTVRRISYGVGCEKVFPMHSPNVAMIETVRKGKVRRAKLYYLRDRAGKAAKVKEKV